MSSVEFLLCVQIYEVVLVGYSVYISGSMPLVRTTFSAEMRSLKLARVLHIIHDFVFMGFKLHCSVMTTGKINSSID